MANSPGVYDPGPPPPYTDYCIAKKPMPTRQEFRAQFIVAAIRAGARVEYIDSIFDSMAKAEAQVFSE